MRLSVWVLRTVVMHLTSTLHCRTTSSELSGVREGEGEGEEKTIFVGRGGDIEWVCAGRRNNIRRKKRWELGRRMKTSLCAYSV